MTPGFSISFSQALRAMPAMLGLEVEVGDYVRYYTLVHLIVHKACTTFCNPIKVNTPRGMQLQMFTETAAPSLR
jgi:hypothetical protein